MGRGSAHASSGEWGKVCKLLAAPLPGDSATCCSQVLCACIQQEQFQDTMALRLWCLLR